jgi:hypothetical protein
VKLPSAGTAAWWRQKKRARLGSTGWVTGCFTESPSPGFGAPTPTTLDDDGNAVFLFFGSSCATGSSEVIADVEAGTHPTYTTTFNINPPQPTLSGSGLLGS